MRTESKKHVPGNGRLFLAAETLSGDDRQGCKFIHIRYPDRIYCCLRFVYLLPWFFKFPATSAQELKGYSLLISLDDCCRDHFLNVPSAAVLSKHRPVCHLPRFVAWYRWGRYKDPDRRQKLRWGDGEMGCSSSWLKKLPRSLGRKLHHVNCKVSLVTRFFWNLARAF